MKQRTGLFALVALALAALLAMPSLADDKDKDKKKDEHKSAPAKSGHADTHGDHGSHGGINPGVPAAVGIGLGVLGALGALSQPPAAAPPPGYQPTAVPPPPPADFHYTNRPTFIGPGGRPCRQYEGTVPTSTGPEPHFGAVCQGGDGVWRIVN